MKSQLPLNKIFQNAIMKPKSNMQEERKKEFVELSEKALLEDDADKMVQLLQQREIAREHLMSHNVVLGQDVEEFLSRETKILERLEHERKKVLKEMEGLFRERTATKGYAPTFPFPPMPAFFDKKG
jgi:hypothetical protein